MGDAAPGEKPRGVKTHLRDMIIVPEMIGSIIGIYNGKMFCGVEMKPEMIGMYLGVCYHIQTCEAWKACCFELTSNTIYSSLNQEFYCFFLLFVDKVRIF